MHRIDNEQKILEICFKYFFLLLETTLLLIYKIKSALLLL